jgi:hypothetical protein
MSSHPRVTSEQSVRVRSVSRRTRSSCTQHLAHLREAPGEVPGDARTVSGYEVGRGHDIVGHEEGRKKAVKGIRRLSHALCPLCNPNLAKWQGKRVSGRTLFQSLHVMYALSTTCENLPSLHVNLVALDICEIFDIRPCIHAGGIRRTRPLARDWW